MNIFGGDSSWFSAVYVFCRAVLDYRGELKLVNLILASDLPFIANSLEWLMYYRMHFQKNRDDLDHVWSI